MSCDRSKSVQEIISRQPDFLTRFAILFFIVISTGLLMSTCFIQYSEKIYLPALIIDSKDLNRRFYALAVVEKAVAEKIKKGQEVILDFPLYPAVHLDNVRVYIDSVSAIPGKNDFAIIVDIPRVLITSNNRQLPYLNGLNTNMLVNTNKISLFNYFFNRK